MKELLSILNQFTPAKILLVGDLMLDVYTIGKVKRISPEAPVAILNVEKEEKLPGGAGNVILNAITLGFEVVALGRIGSDPAGEQIFKKLIEENVDLRGIFTDIYYQTPVKNRIIADHQQIVRVDFENPSPLSENDEKHIISLLPSLLEGIQLIAVSDYGKGFVTKNVLKSLYEHAKTMGIKIIVDPKGSDFTKYKGAFLVKPNLSEAYQAAGLEQNRSLDEVAEKILSTSEIEYLLITLSKDGMALFHKNQSRVDFPVEVKEVKDVTGAGDTVLAMMIAAIANDWELAKGIKLANLAAGISLQHMGCARIQWIDLLYRLLEIDIQNKIFEENHLFILKEVLKNRPFSLLALKSSMGFTTSVFKSIHQLYSHYSLLVIYILDKPNEDFLSLLASLKEVTFIILQTESLHHLCEQIPPEELCMVEEELYFFKSPKQFLELQTFS